MAHLWLRCFVLLLSMVCTALYIKVKGKDPTSCELFEYLYWTNRSACRIVHEFGGIVHAYPGLRGVLDGQKVMCMDLAPKVNDCVVYSFGINDEWSFDQAIQRYGCTVYAFDPSMKRQDFDYRPNIHFFDLGISDRNQLVNGWKMRTLDSIYEMLVPFHGNVTIDYLKLDVESDEWAVLPQIIASRMLDKVKQLAVEVHFRSGDTRDHVIHHVNVLKKLEDGGMVRFASRTNTHVYGPLMGRTRHLIFEMAWYNSRWTSGSKFIV